MTDVRKHFHWFLGLIDKVQHLKNKNKRKQKKKKNITRFTSGGEAKMDSYTWTWTKSGRDTEWNAMRGTKIDWGPRAEKLGCTWGASGCPQETGCEETEPKTSVWVAHLHSSSSPLGEPLSGLLKTQLSWSWLRYQRSSMASVLNMTGWTLDPEKSRVTNLSFFCHTNL